MASRWHSAWVAALGYFACYLPYAALTKAVSASGGAGIGLRILPVSVVASVVAAAVFLAGTGWWRAAAWRVGPRRDVALTVLSGVCASAIIATTTLAYTFEGTSILLMMLLLRGGVLILAPLVDRLNGRAIPRASWLALGLSLVGVGVATLGDSFAISTGAAIDVAVYLAAYSIRLTAMSRLAKSSDAAATRRFFVREQCVSSPVLLLTLIGWAALGTGATAGYLAAGFSPGWHLAALAALIGLLSQGTGIFGALVLLSPHENTFSVPLNRAASILAGIGAEVLLVLLGRSAGLSWRELVGALLIVAAVTVLARRRPATRPV